MWRLCVCAFVVLALGSGLQAAADSGYRLTKAPGLPRAVAPDGTVDVPHNTGPAPTRASCGSAWNAHLPGTTRRWLVGLAPRHASVAVASSTVSGREWRYCVVYVSLDRERLLMAYLHGRSDWKGIVVSPPIAAVSQFTGSLLRNGSIRAS
jgi:hypothetical protein